MKTSSGARGAAAVRRHFAKRTRGQSLVEFALIAPVFMLLLLGAIDFGRIFFSYIQIRNAAGQGAIYAAVNPTDTVGITSRVQAETNAQAQRGENALVVGTTCYDTTSAVIPCSAASGGADAGNLVTVTVTEPFNFFTPLINGLFSNSFRIQTSASAAVLGFVAGSGGSGQTGCTAPTSAAFTYVVTNFGISVDAAAAQPSTGQWAIASYFWDMGDGLDPFPPVTGKTVSYTYQTQGLYTVQLTVQNQCGELTSSQSIAIGTVPSQAPSAAPTSPPATVGPTFTAAPSCTTVPSFTFQFTGQGNGSKQHQMTFQGSYTGQPAPLNWAWDFGDGNTASGPNKQNVSRDYASAGTRTVQLTVTNGSCIRSVSQTVVVP